MKSSMLKKLKRSLLVSGVYMLLIAALVVGISTAKYSSKKLAYTDYNVASFNAVILGEYTNHSVTAFTKSLNASDCLPGMHVSDDVTENTAKTIPFTVANGINDSNASGVAVDYTIRLRTTRNLPIRFSLDYTVVSNENETEGASTARYRYQAGEPELVESNNESGNVWYEWVFFQPAESTENEDPEGEEPQTAVETEACFSLNGGSFCVNNHTLIIEWPVTEADENTIASNAVDYMKEVELLQILVTVSSKNRLDGEVSEYTYSMDELYGTGIIILDPAKAAVVSSADESYPYQYSYEFDFRSFIQVTDADVYETSSDLYAYRFRVGNGVGMGVKQNSHYTDYVLELLVPYTVANTDNDTNATKDYVYVLKLNDEEITAGSSEFRLYDTLYGSEGYNTYIIPTEGTMTAENLTEWTKEDSQYRLYKVYFYAKNDGTPFRLVNKSINALGDYEDYDASAEFELTLDVGDESFNERSALLNTLRLNVHSVLSGTVDTGNITQEPEAAEDEAEEENGTEESNTEENDTEENNTEENNTEENGGGAS